VWWLFGARTKKYLKTGAEKKGWGTTGQKVPGQNYRNFAFEKISSPSKPYDVPTTDSTGIPLYTAVSS
jgi:hypothetical protein